MAIFRNDTESGNLRGDLSQFAACAIAQTAPRKGLTLDLLCNRAVRLTVTIQLNGERFEIDGPVSVADLLARLAIDSRRVAVEHNLSILKRHAFPEVVVREGDTVEIVNFVGGG